MGGDRLRILLVGWQHVLGHAWQTSPERNMVRWRDPIKLFWCSRKWWMLGNDAFQEL